jgi:hypothetical protein
MIRIVSVLCLLAVSFAAHSQYYYKDILSTRQSSEQLRKFKAAGVRSVTVNSFEPDGERTADFTGSQKVRDDYGSIQTVFNTPLSGASELITQFNSAGLVIKTIDTADGSASVSDYRYDNNGRLTSIVNVSTSPGMHTEKEEHHWNFDTEGKPQTMHRIKNGTDTTIISFVLDEKGNVAEENSSRRGLRQTSYYYYYDDSARLTDIVTYNEKARRLLPIYVFEYNSSGLVSSMLVVPEGTDDYQRWVYEYNAAGLKTKETCFNKRRQILGRIEYVYGR